MKEDQMIRVGIYRRVSTLEQVIEGHSLDDQDSKCREYLDRHLGRGKYTFRVFSDEGFSGKLGFARPGTSQKKVRPGLSELVAAIDSGEISTVIFYRLDRLSRNARVWLEFLQDYILKRDITLISIQDSIDTRTPMGRFAAANLALAAELFADITAENVKSALWRRREEGYPTGEIGYGWLRDRQEEDHDDE
jgi:site-specific DNA recombinase